MLILKESSDSDKVTRDRDSQGFPKLKKDAKDGGAVAGRTRKDIEKTTGKKIASKENYLPQSEKQKQIG